MARDRYLPHINLRHYQAICLTVGLPIVAFTTANFYQTAAIAQSASQGNATNSTTFPDVQNHWAQPFISTLAQRNILSGYPDGNYRPTRAVDRDEFAAVIQSAFNQAPERQLPSGSYFKDVPQGHWAESAIEKAYEMGFMRGYPDRTFRPQESVSRVEVLTSLAQNLELAQRVPTTPQAASSSTTQPNAQTVQPQQARRRSITLPLASLSLLKPLMRPAAAQNNAPHSSTLTAPQTTPQQASPTARDIVRQYYTDAEQIPDYAIDAVAAATKAGIVVNHPNLKTLNPNQAASRADIAALIHQALVNKKQLPPLTNNVAASRYIVGRNQIEANRQAQQ